MSSSQLEHHKTTALCAASALFCNGLYILSSQPFVSIMIIADFCFAALLLKDYIETRRTLKQIKGDNTE